MDSRFRPKKWLFDHGLQKSFPSDQDCSFPKKAKADSALERF
jgi:hypothetical protein